MKRKVKGLVGSLSALGMLVLFTMIVIEGVLVYFVFDFNQQNTSLDKIRMLIQLIALTFGATGILIAILNFQRKSGHDVSSFLNIVYWKFPEGSIPVVENVWLMNNKDKSEVIFAIYVMHNNQKIFLKNMSHAPHILGAYSAVKFDINRNDSFIYQWGDDDYSHSECKFVDNNIFDTPDVIRNITRILQHTEGVYIRTFLGDIYAPLKQQDILSSSEDDFYFFQLK